MGWGGRGGVNEDTCAAAASTTTEADAAQIRAPRRWAAFPVIKNNRDRSHGGTSGAPSWRKLASVPPLA